MKNKIVLYGFVELFRKGVPFLVMPVYTILMSTEEYGVYSLYASFFTLASVLVGFKPEAYLIRQRSVVSRSEFYEDVAACFVILLTTLILFCMPIIYLFESCVDSVYGVAPIVLLGCSFFMVLKLVQESVFQGDEEVLKYAILQFIFIIGVNASSIIVLFYGAGWIARPVSEFLFMFLSVFAAFAMLSKTDKKYILRGGIVYIRIKKALSFLLPYSFHVGGFILIGVLDRLIIASLMDHSSVARYSIAYSLGSFVCVIHEGFSRFWTPYFYKSIAKRRVDINKSISNKVYLYSLFSLVVGVFGGFVVSRGYVYIFSSDYSGLEDVIFIVAVALSLEGVRKVYSGYLYISNKQFYIGFITLLALIANVGLNYYLIPKVGEVGAAYSTLFSFAVMSLATLAVGSFQKKIYCNELKLMN